MACSRRCAGEVAVGSKVRAVWSSVVRLIIRDPQSAPSTPSYILRTMGLHSTIETKLGAIGKWIGTGTRHCSDGMPLFINSPFFSVSKKRYI